MPGPEATIERKCAEIARGLGATLHKIRFTDRRGCPDRLLSVFRGDCPCGYMVSIWVEFKRPGARPTKFQELVHQELKQEGISVWVIDSVEDFEQRLEELIGA